MGFSPATEPTLKMALCHNRALVGRIINTEFTNCLLSVSWPLGCPHLGVPTGLKVFLDFAGHGRAATLCLDPL